MHGRGMLHTAHLQSHILEGAIPEGGLQPHLGHILPQIAVLVQGPVLDEVVHLCLDFPATPYFDTSVWCSGFPCITCHLKTFSGRGTP